MPMPMRRGSSRWKRRRRASGSSALPPPGARRCATTPDMDAFRRATSYVQALWIVADSQECTMKLSTARVQQTLSQLEEQTIFQDARAIPDDNPAIPQLNELFGDHTFFLDSDGLHIVEPA